MRDRRVGVALAALALGSMLIGSAAEAARFGSRRSPGLRTETQEQASSYRLRFYGQRSAFGQRVESIVAALLAEPADPDALEVLEGDPLFEVFVEFLEDGTKPPELELPDGLSRFELRVVRSLLNRLEPGSRDKKGGGVPVVPEPATVALLGTGLLGLGLLGRRRVRPR